MAKESPEEVSTKQSLSNGLSCNGLVTLTNGVAGDESSSTFTGASVHVKPNGFMVFKKALEPGTCENPLSDVEATSGRPDGYHLHH